MRVYLLITADKYELPCAVTDTLTEMGKILGISTSAVAYAITRKTKLRKRISARYCKIIQVDIDDEED